MGIPGRNYKDNKDETFLSNSKVDNFCSLRLSFSYTAKNLICKINFECFLI